MALLTWAISTMSTLLFLHLTPLVCAASIHCMQSDDSVSQSLAIECCPTYAPPLPPPPPTPPLHIHPCPSPHLPGGIFLLDPATRCWQPSFGAGGVGPTGTGASVLLPPLHSHYPSHPPPSFPGWFPLDPGARARGRHRCWPGAAVSAGPAGPGPAGRNQNT